MRKGKTTGAKAIVQSLEAQGVEVIFGYPGGANLPIYDELAKSGIVHVLARHEQGAAHMADGYFRLTGKAGVCMATSGPGATNLVTGLATAFMDSSTVVAITGQVPRSMIGNDAFQEVDITGITTPITKHNYLIQEAAELPGRIEEAFFLATTGRRGPVLIDIPKDVQNEQFSIDGGKRYNLEGYNPTTEGHPGQIKKAVNLLKSAKRPLIIAGGGVNYSNAEPELLALSELAQIPVVHTLMGKPVFPNTHPYQFGLMGYHGRIAANTAVSEADVILAVGTRFGDRSTGKLENFAVNGKIIHVDIDPAEISKNVHASVPIVGDAKYIVEQIRSTIKERFHPDWIARLNGVKEEHPLKGKMTGVTVPNILVKLKAAVPDAILVTDVGKHQIFAAHYFPVDNPRSFITSGGLGTMGFGFPAALGAQFGNREKQVVCISGDGSFMMNCQEIATAVEQDLPVLVLVMNNYCLGMVNQLQDVLYDKRYQACSFGRNVSFAALSESLGGLGLTVRTEEEILPAIEKGLSSGRPCVIDCILEDDSNVYPMVTGATLLDYVE
jgi:acetolactate synthase I/II/III large subunit